MATARDSQLEIDKASERSSRAGCSWSKKLPSQVRDLGGESAAVLYSLIGTAKLIGIDPEAYLRNVQCLLQDVTSVDLRRRVIEMSPRTPRTTSVALAGSGVATGDTV